MCVSFSLVYAYDCIDNRSSRRGQRVAIAVNVVVDVNVVVNVVVVLVSSNREKKDSKLEARRNNK